MGNFKRGGGGEHGDGDGRSELSFESALPMAVKLQGCGAVAGQVVRKCFSHGFG